MDDAKVQLMKKKLEEEKAILDKELKVVSDPDISDSTPGERAPKFPNYGDDAIDSDDQSPAEVEDYSINVSVTGTLESKLNVVKAALQRIENGTYGRCTKCKGEISDERLEANPAAEMCIHCAESHT